MLVKRASLPVTLQNAIQPGLDNQIPFNTQIPQPITSGQVIAQPIGQLSRSAYVTPEGIVLPITTRMDAGGISIVETGQYLEWVGGEFGGRLGTYINRDINLVRTTTGQYTTPATLDRIKGQIPTPGDYFGSTFTPTEYKAIISTPTKSALFNSGKASDQYVLKKGDAYIAAYSASAASAAARKASGADVRIANIRANMEAKSPGSTKPGGAFGGQNDLAKYGLQQLSGHSHQVVPIKTTKLNPYVGSFTSKSYHQ